jgi:hypothetical protein
MASTRSQVLRFPRSPRLRRRDLASSIVRAHAARRSPQEFFQEAATAAFLVFAALVTLLAAVQLHALPL